MSRLKSGTARKISSAKKEKAGFPPPTATIPALLIGGTDTVFREFVGTLFDIGSQVRELRLYLAGQLGVSEPQYRLVIAIAQLQKEDGISVSALAEYLWVSNSFVTIEVGKLEQAGWVEKYRNPGDGRGVLLRLSATGREAYLKVVTTIQMINDTQYGHLTEKDLRALLGAMQGILRNGRRALDIARVTVSEEMDGRGAVRKSRKARG